MTLLDQSEANIQVTWTVLTNQSRVFRSRDPSRPIRSQYSDHLTCIVQSQPSIQVDSWPVGRYVPHRLQQPDILHTPGYHCGELCQDIPHINQVHDHQECCWYFDKTEPFLFPLFRRTNAVPQAAAELGQVLLRPTYSTTAKRTEPIVKKSAMKVSPLK